MAGSLKYIAFISMLLLAGCFGKGERIPKPDTFISQQKLEDVLYDLYISDGLLNNPRVRNDFNYKDSVQNYMDVMEEHGLTKEEFEENLNYYFLQKPKKLEAAYDNIMANLSRVEADIIQKRENANRVNRNLWSGKNSFNMPDDGLENMVEFSIPLVGEGTYTIAARLIIYTDDQSIDPRSLVWFWKDDGTEEGVLDMWDPVNYEKNSQVNNLKISKNLADTTFTHLKGRLLDHTSQSGHWEKHSQVTNIIVTYSSFDIIE